MRELLVLGPLNIEFGSLSVIVDRRLRIRWVVIIAYSILLIVMAVLPSRVVATVADIPDWISHALAYGLQSGLIYWGLVPITGWRWALVGAFLGTVAFGAATEIMQLLHPGRSLEFKDLVADAAGALIMCLVIVGVGRGLHRGIE